MEILRCLGLVESVVVAPPDSSSKECFSIAPTVASRSAASVVYCSMLLGLDHPSSVTSCAALSGCMS